MFELRTKGPSRIIVAFPAGGVADTSVGSFAEELLDWIKGNPGKLNYGAVLGSIEHMWTAGFLKQYGALGVHASTPKALVEAHYTNVVEVMKTPSLVGKLAAQGMFANTYSGEATAKVIAEEIRWMTPLALELNLKAA